MLKEVRIEKIRELLSKQGEIQVTDLAQRFHVTEMTIRRDLDLLSKETAVIRTRGGAYLAPNTQQFEPSYSSRQRESREYKDRIASKAVELLDGANVIYLDSGTTTEQILCHIDNSRNYMIVTNGVNIAMESVNHSRVSVYLVGGEFRANTLSTGGPSVEEQLLNFRYDVAFLGANAIDASGNAFVGTTLEVALKRNVIRNSERTYIAAGSSKIGKISLTPYVNAAELDGIITDDGLPEELAEQLKKANVNLLIG